MLLADGSVWAQSSNSEAAIDRPASPNLDEFFSKEMRALLQGSAAPRIKETPSRVTPSVSSTLEKQESLANPEATNRGSSNPLRSPMTDRRFSNGTSRGSQGNETTVGPTRMPTRSSTNRSNGHPTDPPRSLANDKRAEARPLVNKNQRPLSLLESGSIGLLSSTSDDSIDLPPPYDTNEVTQQNATESQEPRRIHANNTDRNGMDRPLSEVVELSNLPVQMGFQSDESEDKDPSRAQIKNRLDPADFSELVKQNSREQTNDSRSRTGNRVVEFSESDRTDRTHETASGLDSNRPVEAKLFDFAKLRERLGHSFSSNQKTEADLLTELNYRVWRGEFQQARQQIIGMDHNDFTNQELWEFTWLTAEVAIGLRDRSLLQAAEDRVKHLQSGTISDSDNRLESIYSNYWSAYSALFQAEPDYVTGVAGFRRVIEQIAQQMPHASPWARQRLAWLLLNSQLEMARCIALGPYQSAVASSDQWFMQANSTVQELIKAELSNPLLRTKVVCQQIECYAEQARFREITPLMNYLATQEHQHQRPDAVDEVMWLRQLVTVATLRCGLLAFNHQQTSWAEEWVQQVLPKLEALDARHATASAPTGIFRNDLATAYWLRGALYQSQRQGKLALQAFDRALQHWPPTEELLTTNLNLEFGERLAIMAVAFWEQGQEARAVQLNQDAVLLIQNAVDSGLATNERLETPIANLAVMTQTSSPSVIHGTETADQIAMESELDPGKSENTMVGHIELAEIRQQLESPAIASTSEDNSSSGSVTAVPNPEANKPSPPAVRNEGSNPVTEKPRRSRLPSRAMIR